MIKNSNIINVHKNTEFSIFKINIFRVLYSVSLQLRGVNAVSKEYVYYIVQIWVDRKEFKASHFVNCLTLYVPMVL